MEFQDVQNTREQWQAGRGWSLPRDLYGTLGSTLTRLLLLIFCPLYSYEEEKIWYPSPPNQRGRFIAVQQCRPLTPLSSTPSSNATRPHGIIVPMRHSFSDGSKPVKCCSGVKRQDYPPGGLIHFLEVMVFQGEPALQKTLLHCTGVEH